MNFQMNMASNANRAWRSVELLDNSTNTYFIKNAYVESFKESHLAFAFITGHPTVSIAITKYCPYYELPIYRTTGKILYQRVNSILIWVEDLVMCKHMMKYVTIFSLI